MVNANDILRGDINKFSSFGLDADKSLKRLKPNWLEEFRIASCDFVNDTLWTTSVFDFLQDV